MGGIGQERDISIQSGNCVAKALKEAGLDVVTSDIGPDNLEILEDSSIDVFLSPCTVNLVKTASFNKYLRTNRFATQVPGRQRAS